MKTLSPSLKAITCALSCACSGAAAQADTIFDVKLGRKVLGTLSYGVRGDVQNMNTTLSNTPLGVFNGAMDASSQAASGRQKFTSTSGAEGKARTVIVAHDAGRALETVVQPAQELTPLSDPSRVPAGIVDPVQAIGQMIHAQDCPKSITIYDGRRAVAIALTEAVIEEGSQICSMSYDVVAGPPHLSPLNVGRAKMKLVYDVSDTRVLRLIDVRHGVFRVKLDRRD